MYTPLHLEASIFLAECCKEAYEQHNNNGIFRLPDNYSLLHSFKAKALRSLEWFGFVLESSESIVVVFRGSKTDEDYIVDAGVFQTPFLYSPMPVKVHKGFFSIYNSCREDLFSLLNKVGFAKKLYITGHSLGGALATLLAYDIALNSSCENFELYTFASPRAGDPNFVCLFNNYVKKSFRILNVNDIVPQLPPILVNPPFTKELWCYDHVNNPYPILIPNQRLHKNHIIESYIERLQEMRSEMTI